MERTSICPQCGNDFRHGDCGHRNVAYWAGISDAERAVIEAARALAKVKSWGQVEEPLIALREAVEALEQSE